MFNPQVSLLYLASATPDVFLDSRSIHGRVLAQRLVLGRYHQTACTDDAVVGYPHGVMHARSRRDGVVVAYGRRLDA